MKWFVYIPDEGDWPLNYTGDNPYGARKDFLTRTERRRMPPGSVIWSPDHRYRLTTKGTRRNQNQGV